MLLKSKYLSNNLTKLDLGWNYLGDEGMKILTTRRVDDDDDDDDDDGDDDDGGCPLSPLKFSQLQELVIPHCYLGPQSPMMLLQLDQLTTLNLRSNGKMGGNALTTLLTSGGESSPPLSPFPYLKDFDIGWCGINPDGCLRMTQSQLLDQLTSFSFSGNAVGADATSSFFTTLLVSNLKSLSVRSCGHLNNPVSFQFLTDCEVDM